MFAKEFSQRQICRAVHVIVHSRPQSPSFLGPIKPSGSEDEYDVRTKQLSQLSTVQPRAQVLSLPSSKDPGLSSKDKFSTQLQPSCFAYCIKATVTRAERASCLSTLLPNELKSDVARFTTHIQIRFLQIAKICSRKKEFCYKISTVMLHVLPPQGNLVL